MGQRLKRFREKLREEASLCSLMEIYGMGKLMLSGMREICELSDTEIVAETLEGKVRIYGEELSITVCRNDFLSISGRINKILLSEGE